MRDYRFVTMVVLMMLPVFFVSTLSAQSGSKQEQSASQGKRDVFSIFKKKDTADPNTQPTSKRMEEEKEKDKKTLKILHKDAKSEVKTAKKERKAAEAHEEAARARADAIKAEKRAARKEEKAAKADEKAAKARSKKDQNINQRHADFL